MTTEKLNRYGMSAAPVQVPELVCPECGEDVWDGPYGSKLAKCWNTEGHESGGTLDFDTMEDDE